MRYKSFRRKFRYWFDNTLNSGIVAQIVWLGIFSAAVVILAALFVHVLNVDPEERDIQFLEALWISLMRTLDPGNLSSDNGWSFRLIMLVVTILGVLIVSTLIGIVNSGITGSLERMRKGRSFVNERNHILVLGWSPIIFSLLGKLVLGRHKHERLAIVVMADRDKVEMEDEIRHKVPHDKKVRIVTRSGVVIDRHDIEIVNPHQARTIVVLAEEDDIHDTNSIKTVMALMKSHKRKAEKYHIIVEVRDRENLEVLETIAKDEITPIISEELFSRITVQTSLQSGLSEVYNELLDFNDVETDFIEPGGLSGTLFGEAALRFHEGSLIGIQKHGMLSDANPSGETKIEPDDKLIVIVQRRLGIETSGEAPIVDTSSFAPLHMHQQRPQKTLILGWNNKAPEILRKLDQHFTAGSSITVFADLEGLGDTERKVRETLKNHRITFLQGNIRSKASLAAMLAEGFNHVILLCYSEKLDIQSADALTLITLIHLRQLSEEGKREFTIVSEVLDIRNRALAEGSHADDFVVSDRLISMVMAQLACNIEFKRVFDELITPGGSEIFLRPAGEYVNIGQAVDFYTIVASAARYQHTAIGYRLAEYSSDPDRRYGVVLAPSKKDVITLKEDDRVIVLGG